LATSRFNEEGILFECFAHQSPMAAAQRAAASPIVLAPEERQDGDVGELGLQFEFESGSAWALNDGQRYQ
jgi:hypothetical protein